MYNAGWDTAPKEPPARRQGQVFMADTDVYLQQDNGANYFAVYPRVVPAEWTATPTLYADSSLCNPHYVALQIHTNSVPGDDKQTFTVDFKYVKRALLHLQANSQVIITGYVDSLTVFAYGSASVKLATAGNTSVFINMLQPETVRLYIVTPQSTPVHISARAHRVIDEHHYNINNVVKIYNLTGEVTVDGPLNILYLQDCVCRVKTPEQRTNTTNKQIFICALDTSGGAVENLGVQIIQKKDVMYGEHPTI